MPRPAAERLKARVAELAQATSVPGVLLESTAVKLTGGPFTGQDGKVTRGTVQRGKVRVLLTAYGKEVDVPADIVEIV